MEHEVYVPFPVRTVRQALTEPERVARCVPGVQLDADAAPGQPKGRLRLRIGGSTITYRGTLTVAPGADAGTGGGADGVRAEAHGAEVRGDGTAALTLTVRLSPAAGPDLGAGPGTTLACSGTVRSAGRLAEVTAQSAATAGRRLLDRFAENLAADLAERPVGGAGEPAADTDAGDVSEADGSGGAGADEADGRGAFDAEVPPPALGPLADADGADDGYDSDADDSVPAEAAHARRTMIGRSAEEVDHAPPRGRYSPVPAPEANGTSVALRWAAPAAAVVLASAVVVGRVLRRRR
ncbi:carbon monoxide dehydrogenase subunit G [Streptomyces sp. x-80]|uniref:carbon monoxide dehydrogenase subunit G n=1 Tax=Streptomyces sp. x-80 TaxID=2789282 RepID=UPI00397EF6DF